MVDHVVHVGDFALGVGDDGELQLGAGDFVDVLDPRVVRFNAVGALLGCWLSCWGLGEGELTRPIILTLREVNSGSSLAKAPSSVVQIGVKSSCLASVNSFPDTLAGN